MSQMSHTFKIDGEIVEPETREAWQATADALHRAWDEARKAAPLYPEAERDRINRHLTSISKEASRCGQVAERAEHYETRHSDEDALEQAKREVLG